ncbi:HAD family phosphatase [Ornithinibacillus gellani]|uniref:HAD family hydrolase n=1 Tax=Ornithinibacillus gellani TaxID=2293253 RepID=UPI000F4ABBCD|nr:HAD family phosphatase [Ornithinibacillus gellani]TQS74981.1 HAD family phosphatase [Ornithinibacillus gellani]
MQQIDFVIFDMDGLLFDTERIGFRAMEKSMVQIGMPFTLDTYKLLIGAGKNEDERIMQEVYGPEFSMKRIVEHSRTERNRIIESEGIRVMPGVQELLDKLDEKGLKRCIASSSSIDTIAYYLELTDLKERFDFYISGDEVPRGKPEPDIFLEACRRGKADPASSLVLEDSLNGLRAAKRAGIKCVLIPDLVDPNEEMKTNAFQMHHSLLDLVEQLG